MRLLFVHEKYGAFGGAEANVLATATALQLRGHTLGFLHGAATGREEAAWREVFARCFPLGEGCAATVADALDAFRPDAVYVHKLGDVDALAALAASAVPVVRMVHDHDLYCLRGYKYNPLNRRICTRPASAFCVFPCGGTVARNPGGSFPVAWVSYRAKQRELALNRRFTRLIVATDFMKEELLRNGFSPAQIEIHPPVPNSPPDAGLESSSAASNRIVYAGQIIRGKGVDVLLESLARVNVPFECVIVGDGSHRAHCEALSRRLGLADRVRFTGFVPQSEIGAFYRTATLAVMSSLWPEPFGAVGLEAMRCGLPVVAFDAGGIREWLINGFNGFLVPWMDRDRYAGAVETLLRDKALAQKMGRQGRKWAGERFGFPLYINGLEDLFHRVRQAAAPAPVPVAP
jgi:glycosyltransferase involved in cell wall biosynthesis